VLFRRGFQGSAVEFSYIYAVIFMRNVTYINEVEGILVHFRLKLRDAVLGIVRSVRLSSDRVVSMIECGHTVGGNVKNQKIVHICAYSLTRDRYHCCQDRRSKFRAYWTRIRRRLTLINSCKNYFCQICAQNTRCAWLKHRERRPCWDRHEQRGHTLRRVPESLCIAEGEVRVWSAKSRRWHSTMGQVSR